MELDDFKTILKTTLEARAPSHSATRLEQSIHHRTVSILDKIRRNIVWEMLVCLLFVPLCIWAWQRYPFLYTRLFYVLVTFICLLFAGYLLRLYKKIRFYEKADLAVKERLVQIIDILQRFTRLYYRFSMGVLPVAFVLGLITGYLDVMHQPLLARDFRWTKGLFVYIGLFAGWSLLMYVFAKWYIRKLYGNYLSVIRMQLEELENG